MHRIFVWYGNLSWSGTGSSDNLSVGQTAQLTLLMLPFPELHCRWHAENLFYQFALFPTLRCCDVLVTLYHWIALLILPFPSFPLCVIPFPLPFLSPSPNVIFCSATIHPTCCLFVVCTCVCFVSYISRSPPVLSSLTLYSSSSCLSSPHNRVSQPPPALNSRGRWWDTHSQKHTE